MPYLLIGAGVAILVLALWGFLNADPKVLARLLRYAAVGALGLLALFLLVTGRGIADLPIAGLMFFLLRHWIARGLPGLARLGDWLRGTPRSPGQSTVETSWLRMALDRASGALDGEVLQGTFQGAKLSQLALEQLRALLSECGGDAQSARLIETYLDRVHAGWREQSGQSEQGSAHGGSGGTMTREEAWEVLGLQPGATPDEIRDAHRRLMTKLHPDLGGSNYLAAKINAARDVLLGA